MPDPINLRMVRKAKKRAAHENVAAQNRAAFGQTKAAKIFTTATNALADRRLDGQRLSKDDAT